MATLADLKTAVDALTASQAAEAARQTAQDAATAAQLTALQATIDALKAVTGLTPEQQAVLDSSVSIIQSVTTSLDAEQPTPPAV